MRRGALGWAGLGVGGPTAGAVSRAPPVLTASCSPSGGMETLRKALHEAWKVPEILILPGPLKPRPLADASALFPIHCAWLGRL